MGVLLQPSSAETQKRRHMKEQPSKFYLCAVCSMCAPLVARQTSSRYSTTCHTRPRTSGVTDAIAAPIRCFNSGVPNRCVATPWCVARDHEVCREIKKNKN
jgi:hypothetical protein